MSDSTLLLALAKVIIAAAWADGSVDYEEINSLKDLLFRLTDMTARDWASLDIYIDSPVGDEERERLIEDLKANLKTEQDKELALASLRALISADGLVDEDEELVYEQIKSELDNVGTGLFGSMGRLMRGPVQRRTQTVAGLPDRERNLDDFIDNRIYYHVSQQMENGEIELDLPEDDIRKLCLTGGLLARVAHVDRDFTQAELDWMEKVLQEKWQINQQAADLIVDIASTDIANAVDYYRLSRQFFECTTEAERIKFTEALFTIAAQDGQVSYDETEEIRTIAYVLKLTHKQFIDAKLTIPREQRVS